MINKKHIRSNHDKSKPICRSLPVLAGECKGRGIEPKTIATNLKIGYKERHMMNGYTRLTYLLLIGISALGCSAPAQPTSPTVERVSAGTPGDLENLWETTGDTLRAHYFRLDRQDRQEGIITTFPETTTNWFEVWRPQPEPAFYWWEANLHTIQRQATVRIKPAGGSGDFDVQVEVERFRYSLPERQVTNAAEALRIFSGGTPTYAGRVEQPSQTASWIPLGRDSTMEEKMLHQIIQQHTLSNVPASQPDF